MKKIRLIIETDVSAWTPEQIAAYLHILWELLAGNKVDMVGDTQIWIFEEKQ